MAIWSALSASSGPFPALAEADAELDVLAVADAPAAAEVPPRQP